MADGLVAGKAKAAADIAGRANDAFIAALLVFDRQGGLRKWMLFKFNQ